MAVAVSRTTEERRPAALLPAAVARLAGFTALATAGALQWQRMAIGISTVNALAWVLAGVVAAVAVLACERLTGRLAIWAPLAVLLFGLLVAWIAAPLDTGLFRPARWGELADGIGGGTEALGTVRLPYGGPDPWPAHVLALCGALLCVLSALLAFWPRGGERGYPFFALIGLLTLVATPVISLGGTRELVFGGVIAALVVAFLWLERLPLRPGAGVAVLLGLALVGAAPLSALTDRDEPWFDYRTFAESLGPNRPLKFDFARSEYGPITWARDGNEVFRVVGETPHYWKVHTLDRFDGEGWGIGGAYEAGVESDPENDLVADWRDRPAWMSTFEVRLRRIRGPEVIGAGTITDVSDATRRVRRGDAPGVWETAGSDLRSGDSYTVTAHVPRPTATELAISSSGRRGRQAVALKIPFRFVAGRAPKGTPTSPGGTPARSAAVTFPAFSGPGGEPVADYPTLARSESGVAALRRSKYSRTWALSQRLREGTETPYEYLQKVDAHLKQGGYTYTERPGRGRGGVPPLEVFLHDTKTGYCQHFAGAMALLLRMQGIPARVAGGFAPGGYSKRKQAWVVRDTDAHAWVEVWFDSWGWVAVDPTPDVTPARSQIAALDAPPAPVEGSDEEGLTAPGSGVAGRGQAGLRGDLRYDGQRRTVLTDDGTGDPAAGVPWWAFVGVGAALLALAGLAVVRLRARRGDRRSSPAAGPVERAIAELEAALRRSGRPLPTGTTLRQLERRLGGSAGSVAYLGALRRARYGPSAELPGAAARAELRRELAAGLGWSGRLRALWALPPRLPRRGASR